MKNVLPYFSAGLCFDGARKAIFVFESVCVETVSACGERAGDSGHPLEDDGLGTAHLPTHGQSALVRQRNSAQGECPKALFRKRVQGECPTGE